MAMRLIEGDRFAFIGPLRRLQAADQLVVLRVELDVCRSGADAAALRDDLDEVLLENDAVA